MNSFKNMFQGLQSGWFLCAVGALLSIMLALPASAGQKQAYKEQQKRPLTLQERARAVQEQRELVKQYLSSRQAPSTLSGASRVAAVPSPEVSVQVNKEIRSASTIYFYDAMESGTNGWTTTTLSDTNLWHQSTLDANSPVTSWYLGLEPQQNYFTNHRVNDILASPPIDLTGASGAVTLLFTESYNTERGWDYCMADVSSDGGSSWTSLRGGYGDAPSGYSYGWQIATLDISAYANKQIRIRFHFDTGDSVNNDFPGWFIDNVLIYDQSGTISGTVYFDPNHNGVREAGEDGQPNWPVRTTGPVTITTRAWSWYYTDQPGFYTLPLPLGEYQVGVVLTTPWVTTAPPAGAHSVSLTSSGQQIDSLDFGIYRPCTIIGGTVFHDLNKDSLFNAGEPGLPGWGVSLSDTSGHWLADAGTDPSGHFQFQTYAVGTYLLQEHLFNRWVSTVPGGNPAQYLVNVLRLDTAMTGFVFGVHEDSIPGLEGVVAGYVFNDIDHNGIQDEREPMVNDRFVVLSLASSPPMMWYARTDSSGRFSFTDLADGDYTLALPGSDVYGWACSSPDTAKYVFHLAPDQRRDSLNFGTYQLPTGSIRGSVFNDVNRNGQRDTLESGIVGWGVTAYGPYGYRFDVSTDADGNYSLNGIAVGLPHSVGFHPASHWRQSKPAEGAGYAVVLLGEAGKDSIDFGAYALSPGSISGTVFKDANGNAVRDSGEIGFAHCRVVLGEDAAAFTWTDDTGHYQFNGLWTGDYTVTVSNTASWEQTYPAFDLPWSVMLGDEENRPAVDFGLSRDSSQDPGFRSFLPESIAFARDSKGKIWRSEKAKPNASEGTFTIPVAMNGLTGIHVEFSQKISSLTVSPFTSSATSNTVKWDLTFGASPDTTDTSQTVIIYARGRAGKPLYIVKYWWEKGSILPYPNKYAIVKTHVNAAPGRVLYPMPNMNNILDEVYAADVLGPNGIVLGNETTRWFVYHPKAKDLQMTLSDKSHGSIPIGPARCLGLMNGKVWKKPMKGYPIKYGNNQLLSEAIAFKVGLRASEAEITPPGFGYLTFVGDSSSPFFGKTMYQIEAIMDTSLSSFDLVAMQCTCDSLYFAGLYQLIRRVDSAFYAPFFVDWDGGFITLGSARYLSDVPFLTIDSSFAAHPFTLPPHRNIVEQPVVFSLGQNYPNPFNPTTTISFTLPEAGRVSLTIYNVLGQQVAALLNKQDMDDGEQEVTFNASSFASGVYFYRLTVEGMPDDNGAAGQSFTAVRKMMLMK